MRKITMLVTALVTVSGLLLAGCSDNNTEAAPPADASFNAADVEFVQSMIPHHEQAVMMSTMVELRSDDPKVKALAADIKAAQGPEIDQMRAWLKAWKVKELDAAGHMSMGHGSGGMNMPGMMSDDQMGDLDDAAGATFDEMFLTMMIDHHEGAIEMAETVKADGKDPEVADLADAIIKAQAAEIATMKGWLDA
jgi:uncharacterized protein (DUF305 family)